jgi:hypothetical protein
VTNPSVRNHDGFYLRLGIGGGYLIDSAKIEGYGTRVEGTIRGAGIVTELSLGGTLGGGFVLGGGIMNAVVPSPSVKVGDHSRTADATVTLMELARG